jgi:hypothetical protein
MDADLERADESDEELESIWQDIQDLNADIVGSKGLSCSLRASVVIQENVL